MPEQDKFEAMEIKTRKQLEEAEKAKKKKKRNYIVGFSILGVVTLGLIAVYVLASQIWLVDLAMLPFCEYTYSSNGDATTATLRKVRPTAKKAIPTEFVVPTKVNGLTITKIADSAFSECRDVVEIKMSDYVTDIGSKAFYGCKKLERITFSKNIVHLGSDAFLKTPFLANLPKDSVSTLSYILFNIGSEVMSGDTILLASKDSEIPDKYKNCTPFYLDNYEGQTLLGWSEALFRNNDHILYAEIPTYLEELPADTFNGCSNLETVKFLGETKVIGESAFANTPKLETVDYNKELTTIKNNAFENSNISNFEIASHITNLGSGIFKGCRNITTYDWPTHLTQIPESTFEACTNLKTLNYDDQKITSIGKYAFAATAIETFKFPIKLSNISVGVFAGNKALTSVSMYEGDTYIDKEGINYDNGITSIGYDAFKNTSLKDIKLYDKNGVILDLGEGVHLPYTVLSMSSRTDSGTNFGGDVNGTDIEVFTFPHNLSSSSRGMFKNAKKLHTVYFDTHHSAGSYAGLDTIAIETFMGCDSITEFGKADEYESHNELPASLTSVSAKAFSNMKNLETFIFPDNPELNVIEGNLFENDPKLETVKFNEYTYVFKPYAFHKNFSPFFKEKGIYIPFAEIDDYNQKSLLDISHRAFYDMVPGVRNEKGKIVKVLKEEEKFPIYLNILESQVDPNKMMKPEFVENTDTSDLNNLKPNASGWYDMATCHVYYKDQWHFNALGNPTPNDKGGK